MTIVHRGYHVFGKARMKSASTVGSGNFTVESGSLVAGGGVAAKGDMSGGGDLIIAGHAPSNTFLANIFDYPAPGTDWTRVSTGAYLGESKTGSIVWIPLNWLKIGDEITGYKLVGHVMAYSGQVNTLDCALQTADKAVPPTITAITSGMIAQQTSGGFDVASAFGAVTVATDEQYHLKVTGTTVASGHIVVLGAEVALNRKV